MTSVVIHILRLESWISGKVIKGLGIHILNENSCSFPCVAFGLSSRKVLKCIKAQKCYHRHVHCSYWLNFQRQLTQHNKKWRFYILFTTFFVCVCVFSYFIIIFFSYSRRFSFSELRDATQRQRSVRKFMCASAIKGENGQYYYSHNKLCTK